MKTIAKQISSFITIVQMTLAVGAVQNFAAPGDLDLTFGIGGKVVTAVTPNRDLVSRVRIQPDGKIVTLGGAELNAGDTFIVRHNSDGSLDTSFGTHGSVVVPGQWSRHLNDFVLLSTGAMIFTGSGFNSLGEYGATAMYTLNSDGHGGFDDYPIFDNCPGQRLLAQDDGKLIVVALCNTSTGPGRLSAFRYTAAGRFDPSFGSNTMGFVDTEVLIDNASEIFADETNSSYVGDALLQPDGKTVISAGGKKPILVRLNADGMLDRGFSSDGIAYGQVQLGGTYHPTGIAIQSDGKIILGGVDAEFGLYKSLLVRFNPDGTIDGSFGANGVVEIAEPVGESRGITAAVAVQADGKIISAGSRNGIFAMARFETNGYIDRTFGTDGFITTPLGSNPAYDTILSLAFQTDGKLVAAGSVRDSAKLYDVGLVRYQAPTSSVAISGRVLGPNGARMPNTSVTLIGNQNVRRIATTTSFGYYAFEGLAAGSTYTITVSSKRYRFEPRSEQAKTSLTGVDFNGTE